MGKGFRKSGWFFGSSDVLALSWFLDSGNPPFLDSSVW